MSNESIIQVPSNVEEPLVLQRFLLRLVEELDIVLGKRAAGTSSQYVAQKQLLDTAAALEQSILDAQERLVDALDLLDDTASDADDEIDAEFARVATEQSAQDGRLDTIDTEQVTQDGRLDDIDTAQVTQDGRLDDIDIIQVAQDTLLTIINNFAWYRPFTIAFPGRNTNGVVTPSLGYNVASVTRSGVGIYDVVLTEALDSDGNLLLARTQHTISYTIADSAASQHYAVTFTLTSAAAGTFTLNIYSVQQGAGTKLTYVAYDPLSTDSVNAIGVYTPPTAVLP